MSPSRVEWFLLPLYEKGLSFISPPQRKVPSHHFIEAIPLSNFPTLFSHDLCPTFISFHLCIPLLFRTICVSHFYFRRFVYKLHASSENKTENKKETLDFQGFQKVVILWGFGDGHPKLSGWLHQYWKLPGSPNLKIPAMRVPFFVGSRIS